MVVNVDVSHHTFWHVATFPMIINQLTGHMNLDTLQTSWRDNNRPNFKFDAMKRLKANNFTVQHKGRSEAECMPSLLGLIFENILTAASQQDLESFTHYSSDVSRV